MLSVRYNLSTKITFGIKRNEGGKPRFFFGAHDDFIYVQETDVVECKSLDCMEVTRGQEPHYTALAIENSSTHEIRYLYGSDWRYQFQVSEDLPDGKYILYPVARSNEDEPWQKFMFYDERQSFVNLNVSNGQKTYANNHIENSSIQDGAVEIENIYYFLDNTKHEATVTFKNDRYGSYTGDVTIPANILHENKQYKVTTIGRRAFMQCKLGTLYIPKTIETINNCLFSSSVDRILFEADSQIKSINSFGFQACSFNSGTLDLPEGLKQLNAYTFEGSNIQRISLPSTFQKLNGEVFSICRFLRTIIINSSNLIKMVSSPFYIPGLSLCTLYVPKSMADRYKQASVWKEFGRILEIGDTVTIEGIKYMLNDSDGTATILSAFDMRHIMFTIPSVISCHENHYKVISFDPFSFSNCPVEELTIPSSVEYIGERALSHTLNRLNLYHVEPPMVADRTEIENNMFQRMFSDEKYLELELRVPTGCKSKYQSDSFWGQFTNIVEDETLGMKQVLYSPDNEKVDGVYSINGIRMNTNNINGLTKGVYVQGKKKIAK